MIRPGIYILAISINTAKNQQKQGRILEGGGEFFWLARIYTPELKQVLKRAIGAHRTSYQSDKRTGGQSNL